MAYNYAADWPGGSLLGVKDAETERIQQLTRPGQPATLARKASRSERESRLMSHVIAETERARSYLYAFHRQWYVNIAAYLGSQGMQAESIAKILRVNLKKPQHRIYHQSNLVGGSVRRLIGYLARSNPDIEFVPAETDDPLQTDYAIGAKQWLDWQRTYDNWKKKRLEILNWAVTCGMGISKAVWDPTGGPRDAAIDDDGEIITDEDGMPYVDRKGNPKTFATGCAHSVVVPPFHWVYGIGARNDEEMNWCGEDSWMSFRYLQSISDEKNIVDKLGLAPEPQFSNMAGLYERQAMQTLGPQGMYTGASPESSEPGCRIQQLFFAPFYLPRNDYGDDMHEKGALLIAAQGRIVKLEPNPFMDLPGVNPRSDWNPYTIWPCYDVAGRMIPQGLPDNLLPLQDAINFVMSRLRESQRLMGQPKWFIPRGSISQKIDSEAGQTITFNPGVGPPQPHAPTPMPAYIIQMLEILENHVERVASQPPMMQGRAQGQVRSGLGVQLLQEQAVTEFTPLIEKLDYCQSRHARQLLLREIQFSNSRRSIPMRTGSGGWEQQLFYAKHMNPEFMVRIVPGTSMPQSKALVMSELDRLVAWGALMPQVNPQDKALIARIMKYEIASFTPDDTEQALRQARYENWIIVESPGAEPPTLSSFNHPVHINEHLRWINSARVQAIVKKEIEKFGTSPTLGRLFNHVGKHYGHMQAAQMGVMLPQPIPPYDDLAMETGSQQTAGGGGGAGGQTSLQRGAGGQGMIGGTTGAQNMTSRGMSIGTDVAQNQGNPTGEAPRLAGAEGIRNLHGLAQVNAMSPMTDLGGGMPGPGPMRGFSGGA